MDYNSKCISLMLINRNNKLMNYNYKYKIKLLIFNKLLLCCKVNNQAISLIK